MFLRHLLPLPRFLSVLMILFQDSNCLYENNMLSKDLFFFFLNFKTILLFLQAKGLHRLLGDRNKKRQELQKHLQLPPQRGNKEATAAPWKQRLYNCTNSKTSRHSWVNCSEGNSHSTHHQARK